MIWHLSPSLISSFPFAHSAPVALAVCHFWECAEQLPFLVLLHLIFSVFKTNFPQVFTNLDLCHSSGLFKYHTYKPSYIKSSSLTPALPYPNIYLLPSWE
jgi:hypothetical protein